MDNISKKNELYVENLMQKLGPFGINFFIEENSEGDIVEIFICNMPVSHEILLMICLRKTIKRLTLRNTNLRTLVPLYELKELEYLDISHNKRLTNYYGLAPSYKKNLKYLLVEGNTPISNVFSTLFASRAEYDREMKKFEKKFETTK